MKIRIDGDACPNKEEIYSLACQYHREMVVYCDYAHQLNDVNYTLVQCDVGKDSVDMAILDDVEAGDLVITQDYGLASLLLMKNVRVLHVSGQEITKENIELLLMSRYLGAKQRKMNKHIKGPHARTKDVQDYFTRQVENICKESLRKS